MRAARTIVPMLAIVLAFVLAAPAAAKPAEYSGKTKEGSKISFVLAGGRLTRIEALVPTSCVSAQGGEPQVGLDVFQPPGAFPLGRTASREVGDQDTAMAPWDVTKTYTVSTRRVGRHGIAGTLTVSWSWVDVSVPKIYVCQGNAHF